MGLFQCWICQKYFDTINGITECPSCDLTKEESYESEDNDFGHIYGYYTPEQPNSIANPSRTKRKVIE